MDGTAFYFVAREYSHKNSFPVLDKAHMSRKIAARARAIRPFIVMDMLRLANQKGANEKGANQKATIKGCRDGQRVIHLELGAPPSTLPKGLQEDLRALIGAPIPGYSEALGRVALRQKIADYYAKRDNFSISADRIAVTCGSSAALVMAMIASFDPGDAVAVTLPGYPAYPNMLRALGCTVVEIETRAEDHFLPAPDDIRRLATTVRGVILTSPSNPTGMVIDDARMAQIATVCKKRGIRLICDEIYRDIVYGDTRPACAARWDDEAIVISGFSKYFLMPGWRLGWMLVPSDMIRSIEKIAQNLYVSPPALSQCLAMKALDYIPQFDANVAQWRDNRQLLAGALADMGFAPLPAKGGFYLYADIRAITKNGGVPACRHDTSIGNRPPSDDNPGENNPIGDNPIGHDPGENNPISHNRMGHSLAMCHDILDKVGVALTSGVDFDPIRGHDWIRFSYSGSRHDIARAIERLYLWRKSHKGYSHLCQDRL